MPFTGGYSPSPERTGGGEAGEAAPLLQRVFESLAQSRGEAYDQTLTSIVGAENMAYARAIAFDLYGASRRFANEMNPATATSSGLLPRWEKILAAPPIPGDSDPVRQARVLARLLRFGYPNSSQCVSDACKTVLGAIFVGMVYIRPDQANVWWPGLRGTGAAVSAVAGNIVTITGLANVPTNAGGKTFIASGGAHSGNNGTFQIAAYVSRTSVKITNNGSPVSPDTISWVMVNPTTPFMSSVAHILVGVNPTAVPGYVNPDGTLNAAFYTAVMRINPVLDWLLPSDVTYDWFVAPASSHSASIGFYLDDPNNLDNEVFDV